tara:strand:+ start:2579 stop:3502 length:924 start_codon:yes stop_codon:yes gene_type:complete
MKKRKKVILLAGPTASGKSKLAIKLARYYKGEIINADSMQVYKEFSVLSSRPSKSDTKKIKHHLYGIFSVKKYFSTGEWLILAKKKIKQCIKSNKTPILVGGTGLYFNAITKGISKIPNIDSNLRNNIRNLHNKIGQKNFYEKLISIDPISKNMISATDTQRTLRAYEVKIFTNKSIYEWISNTKSDFLDFDIRKIFINIPKDKLLKNIFERTKLMFEKKCIQEVKDFLKLRIDKSLSANKIIGVREIEEYLQGSMSMDEVIDVVNIRTRQYAKRQFTWARGHMKSWKMIYSSNSNDLLKKAINKIS